MMAMALLALYGLGITVEFSVGGRITGTEIMSVALLPLAFRHWIYCPLSATEKRILSLLLLWFFGAFLSDIYNNSNFEDLSRGWSKLLFFTLNLFVIRAIVQRSFRRATALIFFLALGSAIRVKLGLAYPTELAMFGDGWKFGYGQFFTISIFVISAQLSRLGLVKGPAKLLPLLASVVNLGLNARNLFGLTALAGVANLLLGGSKRQISMSRIALVLAAMIVAGAGSLSLYKYAATSGLLGLEARTKYERQTSSSLGLILGGRHESLGSLQAIADAPLLGHGSWAKDIKYVELLVAELQRAGVEVTGDPFKDDLIPTHSHILGAWVEHGILGLVFWLAMLAMVANAMRKTAANPGVFTGLYMFIALNLCWDILFSPFSLDRRVITAAWIYLMMILNDLPMHARRSPERAKLEIFRRNRLLQSG